MRPFVLWSIRSSVGQSVRWSICHQSVCSLLSPFVRWWVGLLVNPLVRWWVGLPVLPSFGPLVSLSVGQSVRPLVDQSARPSVRPLLLLKQLSSEQKHSEAT